MTAGQLLDAFRRDPGRARRHWAGRPVRVVASAEVDVGHDSVSPYFVNHVGLKTPSDGGG